MALAPTAPDRVKAWSRTVPAGHVFWEYLDDSQNLMRMTEEYSWLHEQHLRSGAMAFEYDVTNREGTKTYHYAVNLTDMTQRNTESGTVRNLRRLVVCSPGPP